MDKKELYNKAKKYWKNPEIFDYNNSKDPIVPKTSWDPRTIEKQGHDYKRLKKSNGPVIAFTAPRDYVYSMILYITGPTVAPLYFWNMYWRTGKPVGGIEIGAIAFLTIFFCLMILLNIKHFRRTRIFNLQERTYGIKGETAFRNISDIHAVQLIRKQKSFELNIVTRTGQRWNVADYGWLREIKADGYTLSKLLKVPFWDTVITDKR